LALLALLLRAPRFNGASNRYSMYRSDHLYFMHRGLS
jgi:hypothetical protein